MPTVLHADVLPEVDGVAPHERRAAFALQLRPKLRAPAGPVRIVLAVDRSSSMKGVKLERAREAAAIVAAMLRDDDELALVAFDAEVQTLVAPRAADAGGRRIVGEHLAAMDAGLGTALHGAAMVALALANEVPRGHAILLTDGFPYTGVTEPAEIIAAIRPVVGRATLTTIGYGSEIDAALLASMATVGAGHFCHLDEGGDLAAAIGAELATLRNVASSKIVVTIRTAAGFGLSMVPHYVSTDTPRPREIEACLAPAVEGDAVMFPFELAWAERLVPGAHAAALVTVEASAADGGVTEVIELRVVVEVRETRGAIDGGVTRAVCGAMAGIVLHYAAVSSDSNVMIAGELSKSAGWIRGRARAAGLDPERELGATLQVLAMAQALFEEGIVDAPVVQACAEGTSKSYDSMLGSSVGSPLGVLRTPSQVTGSRIVSVIRSVVPPERR